MNLRQLRTFVLIAETGGLTRASNRLHLSVPAASRQILALEREFGVRLFDRIGRRLQLSSDGEDLLAYSRRVLSEAESLGERARKLKAGENGLLRIGSPTHDIEALFAPFAQQFKRRYPGVDVHLVEDSPGNIPDRLERGDVHLAGIEAGDERFHTRALFPIHAVAVFPQGHRLARRATLDITELAHEPLVLPRREFRTRGWVDAACNSERIRPDVLLESAAPHTLIAAAAAGYGVAVVPSNVLILHQGVRAIPLVVRGASLGTWAAIGWHPQRFLPPYAETFVEQCVAYAVRANPGRNIVKRAPPLRRPKDSVGTK